MNDTMYVILLSALYGMAGGITYAAITLLAKTKIMRQFLQFLGLVDSDPIVHTGEEDCELCALIRDSSKDESFQLQVSEKIDERLTGIRFDNLQRMKVSLQATYLNEGHQFFTEITDPDLELEASISVTIPADPDQPNASHFKIVRCEKVPQPVAALMIQTAVNHFERDIMEIWINAVHDVLRDHGYNVEVAA